jgi:hypothetical protein
MAVERSVSSSSGIERSGDMAGPELSDLSMHLLSLSLLEPNASPERLDSGAMWQQMGGYEGFWSPGPARGGNRGNVGTPQSRHLMSMDIAEFLTTPPASRAASSRWAGNVFSPFNWRHNPPAAAAGGVASAEPAVDAAAAAAAAGGESGVAAVMGLLGPPNSSLQQQQQQAAPSQQQQYLLLSMLPPAGANRSSSHRLSSMEAQGPSNQQGDRAATQQQGQMLPPPPQQQQQQAMYPTAGGYNLSNLIPWGHGVSNSTTLLEGANMDISGANVLSTGGVLSSAGHLIHMAADPAAQGPTSWWVQPAGLVPGAVQDRTAAAGVMRPPAAVLGAGVGMGMPRGAPPGTQQQQQQQQQRRDHSQYVQDL